MDKFLRFQSATLELKTYNTAGEAADAAAPPTISIADSAGTVLTSGTSTDAGVGVYAFTLTPAQTANLDVYTATWTYTMGGVANQIAKTYYEVVGGFFFTVAEFRAYDARLASTVTHTEAEIREARDYAEEVIETACGVAFRPRGRRVTLSGTGINTVLIPDLRPRSVISGTIDGTALTAAEVTDLDIQDWGAIVRDTLGYWTSGSRNVVLYYEHGYSEPPEEVKTAAMELAASRLVKSAIPQRAESWTSDEGSFRLSTPGPSRPTGIPSVDAVIARYSEKVPVVA